MRLLQFYWHISWKQKILSILIFLLLGVMRIVILVIPFRYYVKILLQPNEKYNCSMTAKQFSYAQEFGRLTAIMAKFTPWESKCLSQGLTVRLLLRFWCISSIFYLGVGKDEAQQFLAHAWINCNNVTIIGGQDSFNKFKIISQFEDN